MDEDRIRLMAAVEDQHWWFRAKRELVAEVLAGEGVVGAVIDVGCGTGAVLDRLARDGNRPVFGTDLSPVSLQHAAAAGAPVARALAEALPFRSSVAAAVVSLDVVEHLDDDVAGLREYQRVVVPGGLVVVAVPAYQWAWSDHDVTLGHRRRYTRDRLVKAAEDAGLELDRVTHFHSWLAPLAWIVRRTPVRRLVRGTDEEASMGGRWTNRIATGVTATERAFIRRRPLPFGLSILLVARRPVR